MVTERLTTLGFEVHVTDARYDLDVPKGSVLELRPGVGSEVDLRSTVTIVPSNGPPPVPVPDVEGKTLKAARDAIAAAGLHVDRVTHRYHSTVTESHVIGVKPDQQRLPSGSAVVVVVSKGPRPVAIPDVRGKTRDRAVDLLSDRGFEVLVEEDFSNRVDVGKVVATDPEIGTELQPGETVVLTVSLGPEYFDCPSFVGMSVDEAKAAAERVGLKITAIQIPGGSGGNIVSQLPTSGTRVRYGATITVYFV
jgi:beta-lactam-binding protein with PASTA domain